MVKSNCLGSQKESEEVNAIIDGVGDPLFILDKNQTIIRVNQASCDVFKKKPEELVGRHCYEIVHGTNRPFPGCPAQKVLETKKVVSGEIEDQYLNIPLLVTASPILDNRGEVARIVHIAKDISKIKAASTELQIAANLFESASDSIIVHDLEGTIFYFNDPAHKSRGYTKDEFQELSIKDLEAVGSQRIFGSMIQNLLQEGDATFETFNQRKDHTVFPVEVHAQVIESEGKKVILSIARDIAERKKSEADLKESSRKIEEMNEKLRVVGSLTRHDIRNKLSTITGYSYLLRKKHGDLPDVVKALNLMEQAVTQSIKIFEFARMYEQLGVEKLSLIDVGRFIEQSLELFSEPLSFKVINDCQGLSVLADSFLRQLFYNLMDNTRKYGQKVTHARIYHNITESGTLHLIYEDDGTGISTENKPLLFREGFSTGGSTGFGLFLIKRMMDVYDWSIQEVGEAGKGAKFIITIPLTNKKGETTYSIEPAKNEFVSADPILLKTNSYDKTSV